MFVIWLSRRPIFKSGIDGAAMNLCYPAKVRLLWSCTFRYFDSYKRYLVVNIYNLGFSANYKSIFQDRLFKKVRHHQKWKKGRKVWSSRILARNATDCTRFQWWAPRPENLQLPLSKKCPKKYSKAVWTPALFSFNSITPLALAVPLKYRWW